MAFPDEEIAITRPSHLTEVLREVKRYLADRTLRQIHPDTPFASEDIRKLPDQGPWPDLVEAYFEDRDRKRYVLSVEVYHGRGGSWSRIQD
jgi:hypothetical protein